MPLPVLELVGPTLVLVTPVEVAPREPVEACDEVVAVVSSTGSSLEQA